MEELSKLEIRLLKTISKELLSISALSSKLNLNRQYVKGVLKSLEHRKYVMQRKIGRSIVFIPYVKSRMIIDNENIEQIKSGGEAV